ncbi:MAG: class I SAM-dependent methyltransferase [Chitinophagaceae bacterium]|nr:class I SAM-dependent methyltransferase [Chitinophagaceae bacterium]
MYTSLQLAKKYIGYYIKASNAKGHGIHSPFVYDFVENVLQNKKNFSACQDIEQLRKKLLQDERLINVTDHGAGSAMLTARKKKVKDIARTSLKNKKFAQLLFRIVGYYKPKTIIELGTSFGITTAYMASANPDAKIYSIEGSTEIASVAHATLTGLGITNVTIVHGNFDETLSSTLSQAETADLVFIDGDHRKESTIQYFRMFLKKINAQSILIFDDIHWSSGMEEAWDIIKIDPAVTLTIDLFFIGLVFFKTEIKAKQDFVIRF